MKRNFASVIFYSFYIFEYNYLDFRKTVDRYIEAANSDEFIFSGEKSLDLHIHGGRELGRLIHNYAAAWLSLVDHTRVISKKLAMQDSPEIEEFSNVFSDKLNSSVKDTFENLFIKDLRRYVQHKKVPVPTLHLELKHTNEVSNREESLRLDRGFSFKLPTDELKDFNWSSKVKKYINNNSSIDIVTIIERHFNTMNDFYLWIRFRDQQLQDYAPKELKEITFEEWKKSSFKNEI